MNYLDYITNYCNGKNIFFTDLCDKAGVPLYTIRYAKTRGDDITYNTAKKLCETLEIELPRTTPPCTDCFAYCNGFSSKSECTVLNVARCLGEKCSTYKTREQIEEQKAKCLERLNTELSVSDRRYIAQKYNYKYDEVSNKIIDY